MEPAQQVADLEQDATKSEDVLVDSVAIQRLIAEVRTDEEVVVARHYNRTYNRHNR